MIILPPLPVILPPLPPLPKVRDLTPTGWYPVSMDGWHPPVRSGWYEWRRAADGHIDRLWYNHASGNVMAVSGHCPPLVWDAWRGVVGEPV